MYYQQGKQFREADEPISAMSSFIAATRVPSREYAIKGRSFSNMATMCRMGERHDLAYALYEQSLGQFVAARGTLAQAYALNNMAWEQAVQGHKEAAMKLVDSALTICPNEAVQTKVLESQAAACLYAGEYDSVLIYIRQYPAESVYFDMLRAQAYTFLERYDSALYYARRVVTQTENPRYLDDVYYILTYCDASAEVDDIRALAATRSDIQRDLERSRPDWIEAMRMAEEALNTPKYPMKPGYVVLLVLLALACSAGAAIWIIRSRRNQVRSFKQECHALRKSSNVRNELQWTDYQQFCEICNARLSGIVDKLEQRGLSEREIRICVLVLIGFSYAEIAQVLYRAESGIGKDKYMIAKHLGVSVKDLQETLRTLAKEK